MLVNKGYHYYYNYKQNTRKNGKEEEKSGKSEKKKMDRRLSELNKKMSIKGNDDLKTNTITPVGLRVGYLQIRIMQ